MNLEEYKQTYDDPQNAAPGWDAIDQALFPIYGTTEPKHYAATDRYILGGSQPLDGISSYISNNGGVSHEHFISYGMTNLYYDEEAAGGEFSGFGFEFTFRLKTQQDNEETVWAVNLMQNLAHYVFSSGNSFEPGQFILVNGPIALESNTELWALCFVQDPELHPIMSSHGLVQFLQLIGITEAEYKFLKHQRISMEELLTELSRENPLLVTDLYRKSLIK